MTLNVCMIEKIKLKSINSKYSVNRFGRIFINNEYREFCKVLDAVISGRAMPGPYTVEILVACYIDIDNIIKPILDTLQKKGIIDNDRNVVNLIVRKEHIKKNQEGFLEINVIGG